MVLGSILEEHLHSKECNSTNDEIWKLFDSAEDKSLVTGLYYTTDFQIAGRGQGQNTWHSSPGSNILMSLLAQPPSLKPIFQFDILRFISLALLTFLQKIIPSHYKITIKWPNDILIDGQKISGMLIEHRIMGNSIIASVVGIGLNVNEFSFPESIGKATSLRILFSTPVEKREILSKLVNHIRRLNKEMAKNGLNSLSEAYDRVLYGLGEKMLFKASGETFNGIILGTDRSGLLRIQVNSRERYFGFKEISYIT